MPRELDSSSWQPSPELRAQVDAKIRECLSLFPTVVAPVVVYDLEGHVAGIAKGGKKIRLNLGLLNDPRYHDDMLNDTVPHEVAHIIVHQLYPGANSHGWEWTRVMNTLGVVANRCHDYETVAARTRARPYIYACGCQLHYVTATIHRRIEKGRQYYCQDCKGELGSWKRGD